MLHSLHHFLHPLKVLWKERIELFWIVWIALTAFGALLVVWVMPKRKVTSLDLVSPRPNGRPRSMILAVAILGVFLGCYIAGSLVWEDFTYYDDSHYTDGTLAGRNVTVQIVPNQGRFWPLGHQEFSLIRHVTHSIIGYHAFRFFELLLFSGIFLLFDEDLSIHARVGLIILALVTPSILISFTDLIYPEANLLVCFLCLMWFVKRYKHTGSRAWAVAAVISAQFMLYYKETAFLLLLGFAGGQLLLSCWKADQAGWDFSRLRYPENRLNLILALLVVPFFLYYVAAMFPNYSTGYANEFRLTLGQVLVSYLKLDLLVWVFIVIAFVRISQIIRRKIVPSPFWDGLAFAGIGYVAGFLALRMQGAYYLAPADLVAVLYMGHLAIPSVKTMSLGARLCAVVLLSFVVLQDVSLSAFRVYERKNVVHAKAEIGHVIKARYQSAPQNVKRLFFPFATPYSVMEFASYLSYLGVPIDRGADASASTGSIKLVGEAIQTDGPCGYRAFVCHPANTPKPGDLIVVLPDDSSRPGELVPFQQDGVKQIFVYHPRPAIPNWLYPYVSHLHVVSPIFSGRRLPDFWLNALVAAWS